MEFTRLDVVKYLHSRGITPVEVGYRAAVEKYILFRFDLLIEELVSLKKFRNYCSMLTTKVKKYYEANSNTFERMINDVSHKVVSIALHLSLTFYDTGLFVTTYLRQVYCILI